MKEQAGNQIFVAIVLLASLFTSDELWFCQGHLCGTTLGYCCCAASTCQDEACHLHANNKGRVAVCPSGCDCQMVNMSIAARVAEASPLLLFPPALLPSLPPYNFAILKEPLLSGRELRGPPRAPNDFACGLRAPPVA